MGPVNILDDKSLETKNRKTFQASKIQIWTLQPEFNAVTNKYRTFFRFPRVGGMAPLKLFSSKYLSHKTRKKSQWMEIAALRNLTQHLQELKLCKLA